MECYAKLTANVSPPLIARSFIRRRTSSAFSQQQPLVSKPDRGYQQKPLLITASTLQGCVWVSASPDFGPQGVLERFVPLYDIHHAHSATEGSAKYSQS